MIGPIFSLDLLRAARRGGHHRFRLAYSLALALESAVFLLLLLSRANPLFAGRTLSQAEAGEWLWWALQGLVLQQFCVLLLAAPAFAAGTLTDEKATGTLQYLLTTPLTAREIILDRWLALVVQLTLLALPGMPLLVFLGTLLGCSLSEVLALVVVPLAFLGLVVAAALLCSVWSRKTTSAILWLYAVLGSVFLTLWLAGAWENLGPLALLDAVGRPDGVWPRLGLNALVWGAPIIPCLVLAAWRLRPAFRKQLPGKAAANARWRRRLPPMSKNPIRWRERYLADRPVLTWLAAVPQAVRLGFVMALTVLAYGAVLVLDPGGTPTGIWVWLFVVPSTSALVAVLCLSLGAAFLAGILAAVRCAASISGERERQTWDLLLLTPLETKTLLRGKLWGVLDSIRPYLLAYLAAALPVALLIGVPALVCVVFVWLASWLLMYFTGATGIECSAAAVSSWRGLLLALLWSFRTVLERFIPFGLPFGFLGAALGYFLSSLFGSDVFIFLGFTLSSLGVTALLLLSQAEYQLDVAEKHIAGRERVAPLSEVDLAARHLWSLGPSNQAQKRSFQIWK
jgi:ABC-type transport system involved in multi-copper enzyme maturation permease subunit